MKKSFTNPCTVLSALLLLAGSGSRTAAEPPVLAPGFALTLASNQVKAVPVSASQGAGVRPDLTLLQCGNLIYNGNKSSVCFADRFLTDVAQQTSLRVNKKFCPVRLDAEALFDYPFCVMSGNENFSLNEKERRQLRKFLTQGGFLLASPGCSDEKWDQSFRQEIKVCFPEYPLEKIPMTHPVFSTVNPISRLTEKHGKPVMLEGLEINGRLVLVYSKEGLNDVEYAKGCCCCGGNEIQNPGKVNVNIFAYAVLY